MFIQPTNQSSIAGTYVFSTSNIPSNNVATGQYGDDSDLYVFSSGSVSITDLGNNSYKIEFNNAKISPFGSSLQVPVTGYFEGKFY